jgi:hypothetical protein
MANRSEGKAGISVFFGSCRIGFLALATLLATVWTAPGQTVLARARTGNNLEAMTFVDNGPLENSIVFVDGHQLRSVSADPCRRHCNVNELLDLKVLNFNHQINGLAYVSAEKKFLLWDISTPDTWFVLDRYAQPLAETRTITHLPGLGDNGVEGMVYLPSSAKRFGDRVLALSYDADFVTHVEVIKRNGEAVDEIVPKGDLEGQAISGIGYRAPDQLLLGTFDNFLWAIDFDGNVVEGPIDASPNSDFEGVIQTSAGKIAAGSYLDGNLLFFDKRFNRLPGLDRDVRIGIGKTSPFGVAWDPDTQSLLMNPDGQGFVQELDALPVSLDSYVQIASLEGLPNVTSGLTYLPDEHRIGVAQAGNPRAVLLFDHDGAQTEEIDFQNPSGGSLIQVTWVPSRQEFAYKLRLTADTRVHFADRNGAFLGNFELSPLGFTAFDGLVFFPAGPGDPNPAGNLAVTDDASKRVVFMDVDATTILGEMDFRSPSTLNMVHMRLGYISNGSLEGSFVGFDFRNSEIVIFRR